MSGHAAAAATLPVIMSWRPAPDPQAIPEPTEPEVETLLEPRERDLGDGFFVRRLLPSAKRRAVGPFVFFDHFGPTTLPPGKGLDVRPHPHINLATVTYLFDGEIVHRDSLGSHQKIQPGDINWMTAGRGIVHSERTDSALRARGASVHGLQLWVALPREHEEAPPAFNHYPAAELPEFSDGGVDMRLLVGEAFGRRSPVTTFSRLVYLDVRMRAGATVELPDDEAVHLDLGAYVVEGSVTAGGQPFTPAHMMLFRAGRRIHLRAETDSRFVVVGGDPFPEPRHIWWNFVSSSEARIDQAARDWRERRGDPNGPFPLVPGDEAEFIPSPDR
jgi:redox-sensitive bicupin YhaK (pirin superfamily)